MSKSTLVGNLTDLGRLAQPDTSSDIDFEPLHSNHREQLADLYHSSYPPTVGAANNDEALAEMDATLAGDYGELITDASLVALLCGKAVGSIQVVHRSPWDPDLHCPFIIELFVRPDTRERGIARSLLARTAIACQRLGETQIALRTNDEGGTAPAALHLYELAGMRHHPSAPVINIERRRDPHATEQILRALPSWFGIEDAIKNYARDAETRASYLAVDSMTTVGVALLEQHFPESAELYLIAVHPAYRGQGIGTKLIAQIEQDLRQQSVSLFQVKTVGESFADPNYAETRAFYRSSGFLPLEEMTGVSWDGPTLIMAKSLKP